MGTLIFIYCKRNKKGIVEAIPFLEYINSAYDLRKESDLKKLIHIKAHILHIANNNAIYNQPPYAEQYRGRNIGVLKVKESEKLLRIAFYTKINDRMIILSAKHKPKLYEKGKKQQVDKEIKKWLDEAEYYVESLKNSPSFLLPFSL